MTGLQFADIMRDAAMLSGSAAPYEWVRGWKTARGLPLGIAAAQAAEQAGTDGFLALWLRRCAQAFCDLYTADAPTFARAMTDAANTLRSCGAALFPAAAAQARRAKTFSAWSAAAYAVCLHAHETSAADEDVFLPWLCAMCARYAQE